ncbi:dopamine N-acetyltransferase [Drosophila sechellia]|uniref:aralkylamine N-acetyltransferase n=1 Tax=Drosophila sechellia TaxID=7238 RepID=B4HPD8_DROSE|nr:dopamine N-acetyltransferase [Drosophila sechellia]EDW48576.1 GM21944 [Drosophila sechellia]
MTPTTIDGVTIRIMRPEDYPQVKAYMEVEYYTAEPLSQASGEPVHLQNEEINDALYQSIIAEGTSLLALDENDGGRIVGLVLACAIYPDNVNEGALNLKLENLEDNAWGRIYHLVMKAKREVNLFERYDIPKALYSDVTSVASWKRGKGLGSRLAATLMDLGRSNGFPLMMAFCTSFYSARQKEALGMECIYSIDYADYKDDEGRVIFTPAAPHTKLRVMAIKL